MHDWVVSRGIQHLTADYHDLINDHEVQALLIFSATASHVEISIAAVKAGKHAFCEKVFFSHYAFSSMGSQLIGIWTVLKKSKQQ